MLAAAFLHEVMGPNRIFELLLGFTSVLVTLRPGFVEFHLTSGLILVSAFTGASAVVTGKGLLRAECAEQTVFYLTLFAVPFALMPTLYFGNGQAWKYCLGWPP